MQAILARAQAAEQLAGKAARLDPSWKDLSDAEADMVAALTDGANVIRGGGSLPAPCGPLRSGRPSPLQGKRRNQPITGGDKAAPARPR
jgi:hypothetical protein